MKCNQADVQTSSVVACRDLAQFRPARDRMAKCRSAARQRRLFRLSCRLRSQRRESTPGARVREQPAVVLAALMLVLVAVVPISIASAESGALPEHARLSRYGMDGWDCVSGFRREASACVRVIVPDNAYLDSSGSGWHCSRGYLTAGGGCSAVIVPKNAYLDESFGTGWRCDRGYREVRDKCVAVQVPENGYAADATYGPGWGCVRGFKPADGACVPVVVPANGFLSRAGDDWQCERGFRKDGAACAALQVPANAHLDYSGNDWRCDVGFHAHEVTCVEDQQRTLTSAD